MSIPVLQRLRGRSNRQLQEHRAATLVNIRRMADSLAHESDANLLVRADQVRDVLARSDARREDSLEEACALSLAALHRTLGIQLYDVQILAAWALARGDVAEMQTGEGKTMAAMPAAVLSGLTGQGVHVVTTNTYLAGRDYRLLQPAYEALGLSVGLLPERSSPHEKRTAYRCDVTYGTGYEFGFDYLRNQVSLRHESPTQLGDSILAQLRGLSDNEPTVIQRNRAFAIVDEVDHVLIDDAESPLVLSATPARQADDADVHRTVRTLLPLLQPDYHFRGAHDCGLIELTPQGRERIYATDIPIPVKQLRRTWTEYVEQALRAQWLLRRDVHYIVKDNAIQIVDAHTGRIFTDRTWRDGLHQAIEAKENLSITAEAEVMAQITRQRYFRLYDGLSGMTGTATGCEREFRSVYGLQVESIPLRIASCRLVHPLRSFRCGDAKWSAMVRDIATVHRTGRPILVGTHTIADSERLADALRQRGLPFQLLNGRQDAEEAQVISEAGRHGAITLSTNLAGRGTDIRLAVDVAELGGLHVMVAEPHESSRVDRQLIGRCARQGDPGSAQIYMACGDGLIRRYGAWLERPLTASTDQTGEMRTDLSHYVRRMQRAAERQQYVARMALLRRDIERDSLLSHLE